MNLRSIFSRNFLKRTNQFQWTNIIRQSSSESLKVEPCVDVKVDDVDKITLARAKIRQKIVSSTPIRFVQGQNNLKKFLFKISSKIRL